MADASSAAPRILLAGDAEAALVDATTEAFERDGAAVGRARAPGDDAIEAVDVAVCFVRPTSSGSLLADGPEGFESHLDGMLGRSLRTIRAIARAMAAAGGGSIVVVGTVDATHAYAGRAVASVAMGALLGLVRSIAVELSADAVRANLVIVGPIGDAGGAAPADAADALVERTLLRAPMGRLGSPAEAASVIRFVAGSDAAFMTGQTMRVDGGWASLNQAPEGMRFR